MTTIDTFPETAKARSNRRNIGIVALVLALPAAGCGIWLLTSSQALSGLGGLAIGIVLLTGGLHGVLSKPRLTVDDNAITISGFIFPNSNLNMPFSAITHAKVTGAVPSQVLWLETAGRPPRVIESFRYERFEEMLRSVGERLEQLGHPIEVVQPAKPA